MLYFQVSQLLARYARGVDRRDWALVRSAYHPDAVDEHGTSSGSVETFIEGYSQRSQKVTEMMHVNANIALLERDDERREVLVETSCVAWSRVLPEQVLPGSFYNTPLIPTDSTNARVACVANRYFDLIAERDGELRFAFRRVIFEWVTVAEAERSAPFGAALATSARNSNDPSYRTLSEVRSEYLARRPVVHPHLTRRGTPDEQ